MNKDIIEGNWKQLKGAVLERWGSLTDDSVDKINGNREQLLGAIQKSYGVARDEAEKQVREWEKSHRDDAAA